MPLPADGHAAVLPEQVCAVFLSRCPFRRHLRSMPERFRQARQRAAAMLPEFPLQRSRASGRRQRDTNPARERAVLRCRQREVRAVARR